MLPKWPLDAPFSAKKVPKGHDPELHLPTQSRPGREMAPKTPQNDPRIEFYGFLNDFGPIWVRFFMIFAWFLTCCCMLFFVILNESAFIFFVVFSKTQTPNPTDLQTTFLEPWNDKATKRRTTKRTPPNSKTFLRPGGMRASALNSVKKLDTVWSPFGTLSLAFGSLLAPFPRGPPKIK